MLLSQMAASSRLDFQGRENAIAPREAAEFNERDVAGQDVLGSVNTAEKGLHRPLDYYEDDYGVVGEFCWHRYCRIIPKSRNKKNFRYELICERIRQPRISGG